MRLWIMAPSCLSPSRQLTSPERQIRLTGRSKDSELSTSFVEADLQPQPGQRHTEPHTSGQTGSCCCTLIILVSWYPRPEHTGCLFSLQLSERASSFTILYSYLCIKYHALVSWIRGRSQIQPLKELSSAKQLTYLPLHWKSLSSI